MNKKVKEILRRGDFTTAAKEVFRTIREENLVFPIARTLRIPSSDATAFLNELETAFMQHMEEE